MTRRLREEEDAFKARAENCAICGNETKPEGYAIVVGAERLCLRRCFGWFSGYPWVLFELGRLISDLRDYDLEVRT